MSESSPSGTPAIDVLMPAYNAGWSLRQTLDSIRAQTFRDFRVIAVDDGSTDDTPAILAEAARLDPRITVLRQPNAGIVAALNAGLARCTAAFVARHDADDLSDPDRFERQLRFLQDHPGHVAVSGAARHIGPTGALLGTQTTMRDPATAAPDTIPAMEPYLLHPMLMARLADLRAVGGYRLVLHSEDSDLYWRLSERGRLHNMTEVLGSYRLHGASISSRSVDNGRRLAVSSQLGAIDARRRRQHRPGLTFDAALARDLEGACSMGQAHAVGCRQLAPAERDWLALALAAKLVELCFYRPFEPTPDDCRFIRRAVARHGHLMTPRNAAVLSESLVGTAVRLAVAGRVRSAATLCAPRLLPVIALRVLFRVALPDGLRRRIKRSAGRDRPGGDILTA